MSVGGHDIELIADKERGVSVFGGGDGGYGTTVYYPFAISGAISRNATSFSVRQKRFPIQNDAFIVPTLSTLKAERLNVSVALASPSSCTDIEAEVAVPVTQIGTLAPRVINVKDIMLRELDDQLDGYVVCSTSIKLEKVPRGLVTITVFKNREPIDQFLVGGEKAGW